MKDGAYSDKGIHSTTVNDGSQVENFDIAVIPKRRDSNISSDCYSFDFMSYSGQKIKINKRNENSNINFNQLSNISVSGIFGSNNNSKLFKFKNSSNLTDNKILNLKSNKNAENVKYLNSIQNLKDLKVFNTPKEFTGGTFLSETRDNMFSNYYVAKKINSGREKKQIKIYNNPETEVQSKNKTDNYNVLTKNYSSKNIEIKSNFGRKDTNIMKKETRSLESSPQREVYYKLTGNIQLGSILNKLKTGEKRDSPNIMNTLFKSDSNYNELKQNNNNEKISPILSPRLSQKDVYPHINNNSKITKTRNSIFELIPSLNYGRKFERNDKNGFLNHKQQNVHISDGSKIEPPPNKKFSKGIEFSKQLNRNNYGLYRPRKKNYDAQKYKFEPEYAMLEHELNKRRLIICEEGNFYDVVPENDKLQDDEVKVFYNKVKNFKKTLADTGLLVLSE